MLSLAETTVAEVQKRLVCVRRRNTPSHILRPWLGRRVDWIVVGGETGAKDARYMDRTRRVICAISAATALALFLKQREAATDRCRSDGSRYSVL